MFWTHRELQLSSLAAKEGNFLSRYLSKLNHATLVACTNFFSGRFSVLSALILRRASLIFLLHFVVASFKRRMVTYWLSSASRQATEISGRNGVLLFYFSMGFSWWFPFSLFVVGLIHFAVRKAFYSIAAIWDAKEICELTTQGLIDLLGWNLCSL